ncbi:MAG: DUF1993 domain-containing protein [Proteobacteria bacterium]|nr:DUF1993 domain-containing protein [Pseudomonadota bacterium]
MTISMYRVSVPIFARTLTAVLVQLNRAEKFADSKNIDHSVLLGAKLYPEMYPFQVQIGQACSHATRCIGLLAGIEPPKFAKPETTFAGLKIRVSTVLDFVNSATPAQIDGSEDKELQVNIGGKVQPFRAEKYLIGYVLPNFYFHYTTAYNILRSVGMTLGKQALMGPPIDL